MSDRDVLSPLTWQVLVQCEDVQHPKDDAWEQWSQRIPSVLYDTLFVPWRTEISRAAKRTIQLNVAALTNLRTDLAATPNDVDGSDGSASVWIQTKQMADLQWNCLRQLHPDIVASIPNGLQFEGDVVGVDCWDQPGVTPPLFLPLEPPAADEPDTHSSRPNRWRVLSSYGDRRLAFLAPCCMGFSPALTSGTQGAEPGNGPDEGTSYRAMTFLRAGVATVVARFRVIIQNKQVVRDYRAGLLRLVDGILTTLRHMLAVMVAALAHKPYTPVFLLVMLATARRYGRRGEPDAWTLSASALIPEERRWGVACLAA